MHAFGGHGGEAFDFSITDVSDRIYWRQSLFFVHCFQGHLYGLAGGYGGHIHHIRCIWIESITPLHHHSPHGDMPLHVLSDPTIKHSTRHLLSQAIMSSTPAQFNEALQAVIKYGRNLIRVLRSNGDISKYARARALNGLMDSKITQR